VGISAILVVASIAVLATKGLNLGIEFKGGTEIQLKFPDTPDLRSIRASLGEVGVENYQVTRIGDPEDNEVYIKVGLVADASEQRDVVVESVLGALRTDEFEDLVQGVGMTDLNQTSQQNLAAKLAGVPAMTEIEAEDLAARILERRREVALFTEFADLADVDGMTPAALEFIEKQAVLGPFALRSQSYIGPAIGSELMQKALWAILGSMAGMLVYIWIRFEFQWGLAAVVALAHDAVITLGLFSLFGKEMSLPVVAAFLTLIGYSVNDTVVVFDRIRENLRTKRSSMELADLINLSINRTLSRTIITSGLTWVVVVALFLFGGPTLNPFAFVLVIGTVVGTYSSIFIASPILVFWQSIADRSSAPGGAGGPALRRPAKKIPSAR
jgi:preprotein translocase subunit SecF